MYFEYQFFFSFSYTKYQLRGNNKQIKFKNNFKTVSCKVHFINEQRQITTGCGFVWEGGTFSLKTKKI